MPVPSAQVSVDEDIFSKTTSVEDRNQAADPVPASAANGVIVSPTTSKTPGGLKNNRTVTRVEKPVASAQVSEDADIFSRTLTVESRNQTAPAGAAFAGGGMQVSPSSSLTPGGRRNNRLSVRREIPVAGASVSYEEDTFSSTVTVEDRNSYSSPAPSSVSSGVRVASSGYRTPGGLSNNRKTTTTEKAAAGARKHKTATTFEEREAVTDINGTNSALEATAADGKLVETSVDKTPGGRFNRTKTTTTEKAAAGARKHKTATTFEEREAVTDINGTNSALEATAADGKLVETSVDKTPGGRFNRTKTTTTEKAAAGAKKRKSVTAFEERETLTNINGTDNTLEATAENGKLVETSLDQTPGGRYNKTKTTVTERVAAGARKHKTETVFETREVVTDVNGTDATLEASVKDGKLIETSLDRTPGGRHNKTKTTTTEKTVANVVKSEGRDAFTKSETTESVTSDPAYAAAAPSGGVTEQVSRTMTPAGRYRKTVRKNTELAVSRAHVTVTKTPLATVTHTTNKGQGAIPALSKEYGTLTHTLTPGKLYDTVEVISEPVNGAFAGGTHDGGYGIRVEREETISLVKDYGLTGLSNETVRSVSFSPRDDGSYLKTVVTEYPLNVDTITLLYALLTHYSNDNGTSTGFLKRLTQVYTCTNVHQAVATEYAARVVASEPLGEVSVSFGLSRNKFGLWDGHLTFEFFYKPDVRSQG